MSEQVSLNDEISRLLEFTISSAGDSIQWIGPDGHFVHVNQAACQMLGYSCEELMGMSVSDIDPNYPPEKWPIIWNELEQKKKLRFETAHRTRSGRILPVEITANYIQHEGKSYSVAFARDITERKEASDMLAKSRLFLTTIIDAIPDALIVVDRDHRVVLANRAARDFAGGVDPVAIDMKCHELFHNRRSPCEGPLDTCLMINVFENRSPMVVHHQHYDAAGGEHTVEITAAPIFNAQGQVVEMIEVCRDITDRKRAEEESAAAKRSAEEANQAKDHFLAILSHELRTPLTPVVMGVSMLQDRPDLDPKVRETLAIVRSNAEMESQLIDDLLDVTRIARGKIELNRAPIELRTVIQRAVDVCKADIEARRLHFGVDMGSAAPYWIEADSSRLQQVFWNLLKNAIKFTPNGGCVGIRCRPSEAHVLVEVNDSGIGIEPESLSRIFDAFEQAERSITRQFGGLGLGLAISKALVEMHGGQIEAHSEGLNRGATFRVRLPLSAPVKQTEARMPATPPQAVVRPLRILLVEDHGVTAQMIRMVLTEKGHSVETAGDVSTALELADLHTFDLLLSDLGLPDGSGHGLMRELRKRGHKFPGIALSGYGQEDDIHQSYQAGFTTHLTKPASREAIFAAVAAAAADNGNSNPDFSITHHTPVNVPIFDADAALERCFGKREMLDEMVNTFPEESTELLSQMRTALSNGGISEIGRAAHRLRGSVVFLGAQPASNAALEVEQASKSGDLAAAAKAIKELEHQIDWLKKTLASKKL